MDGAEGWSTMRCAGGVQDTRIINRTMIRFRPIAPKPTAGGPLPGGSAVDNPNVLVSRRRTKRKYVRVRRSSNGCNKGKGRNGVASEEVTGSSAVTLQLLPENCTEGKDPSNGGSRCSRFDHEVKEKQYQEDENPFIWRNLMSDCRGMVDARSLDRALIARKIRAGEAWVTVKYVRETCMDGRGLGCTDFERLTNLEGDTCPGFISDSLNRVLWVNGAFRKMVSEEERDGEGEHFPPEMEVWLVMKERLPYKAFTCQVKVQHTWGKEKYNSQMVPGDAWRMDSGGFAWRLDVKAALSLGR